MSAIYSLLLLGASGHLTASEQPSDPFDLTIEELLDIEVTTASKTSQKQSAAPSIINVLTGTQLKQLGATTLAQALELLPGFTPITQLKSDRIMVVRGLGLKDGILVLVDGTPVNDAFDGSFNFYNLPLDDINRVEVIRGPGSALYGGYALSAVIQLFTKTPTTGQKHYWADLGGGSNDLKRVALGGSQDLSRWLEQLAVSGSFSWEKHNGSAQTIVQDFLFTPTQGNYLPPLTNPTLTPTKRAEAMEKFNGHFNLSWQNWQLNFGHQQLISNPQVSHLGAVTEPEKTIKDNVLDKLSLRYQNQSWHGKLYWTQHEEKLYGQSLPAQFWGDENQDGLNEVFHSGVLENFRHVTENLGVEFEWQHQISDKHQVLLGVQYNDTTLTEVEKIANVSLRGRGPISLFPAQDVTDEFMSNDIQRTTKAAYLQDQWQVSNSTDVTIGLRFDQYSDFGSTINPRLAVVKRLGEQSYTKLLYGEAFKPPGFAQLFDATPTLAQTRIRGNNQLQPTEITSIEWQLGYDFSTRLTGSVTLFNNDTDNEIFFNNTPGIEKWQNAGERRSKGVELEIKGSFDAIDMAFANYAYQRATGVALGAGANIHPAHRINAGVVYNIQQDWQTSLTLSYFSSPKREQDDPRARVDEKLILGWRLGAKNLFDTNMTLDIILDNLTDDKAYDETELAIGLLQDIPRPGRTIAVNIGYQF